MTCRTFTAEIFPSGYTYAENTNHPSFALYLKFAAVAPGIFPINTGSADALGPSRTCVLYWMSIAYNSDVLASSSHTTRAMVRALSQNAEAPLGSGMLRGIP
jgi:hypothetical protein